MAAGCHILIDPPNDLWTGETGGTAELFATLLADGSNAPIVGRTIHFDLDDGSGTTLGAGITNAAGLATVSVPISSSVVPGDYDVRAKFDSDGTFDDADLQGTLRIFPGPPPPPASGPGSMVGDTDQGYQAPTEPPAAAAAIDPFTGESAVDPYTNVPNVDSYTGQPAADPFSGQPLTATDRAVRDLINDIYKQPPVDFSGIPRDVQDAILDVYNQTPIESPVADMLTSLYRRPAFDFRQAMYNELMAQQGMTISEYLGLNFADRFAAGISDALHDFQGFYQDVESTYRTVARDFEQVARVFHRVMGGVQAVGGLLQAVEGATFAFVTAETGIGAVAGIAYAANGLDNFYTGLLRASGEDAETATYEITKAVAGPTAARVVDVGAPLAGGFGLARLGSIGADARALEELSQVTTAGRSELSVTTRPELVESGFSSFRNDAVFIRGQETRAATPFEIARYESGMRQGGIEIGFWQDATGRTRMIPGSAMEVNVPSGPDITLRWHSHPDAPGIFSGGDIAKMIETPAAPGAEILVTGPKWAMTNQVLREVGQAPEQALVTTRIEQAQVNVVGASKPHPFWEWLRENPPQ